MKKLRQLLCKSWKWLDEHKRIKWTLFSLATFSFLLLFSLAIFLYYLMGVYPEVNWKTLPPGPGAKGPGFSLQEKSEIPYLMAGGLPYPTPWEKSNHPLEDLEGTWKFRLDPQNQGEKEKWFARPEAFLKGEEISVPSTYNPFRSQRAGHKGITWYFRTFKSPWKKSDSHFVRLCFQGVLIRSKVWLNGELLGEREGGYTPFYFDISQKLLSEGGNRLVVRADNRNTYTSLPPRLREVDSPGWATYGGIYRPVYLERIPRQYIFKVQTATIDKKGKYVSQGDFLIHNYDRHFSLDVEIRLLDKEGRQLGREIRSFTGQGKIEAGHFAFPVDNPQLWNPTKPYLYNLHFSLRSQGRVLEEGLIKIGLRTIEVKGSQLLINGRHLQPQGISKHEDHPRWGATQPKSLLDSDYRQLKNMGANYLRLAHYPHSLRALRAARDQGFYLSGEIPLYQAGMGWLGWLGGMGGGWADFPGGNFGLKQLHRRPLLLNGQRQLIEMIERDRNNPAVILWSVGNECYTLQPETTRVFAWLQEVAHRFDSTRPVTYAEMTFGVDFLDSRRHGASVMDVASINTYYGWYFGDLEEIDPYLTSLPHQFGKRPIILSEFGAGAAPGRSEKEGEWTKTSIVKGRTYSEEYQARVLEEYVKSARKKDFIAGLSPWVYADFYCPWFPQNPVPYYNTKGVVSRDRIPKKGYFQLKKLYEGK